VEVNLAAMPWLGVDVGGKRKGFDYAVIDRTRVVEIGRRLARAVCGIAVAAALTARQHTDGRTERFGGIVVPVAAPPAQ
jgi:hypothetical protein